MKEFICGFLCLWEGLRWLGRERLRAHLILPSLVSLLSFSLAIWMGYDLFGGLLDRFLPEDAWYSAIRWLLWPLFALAVALVVFYGFTLVANLVGAPFNGRLAAEVERLETGKLPQGGDLPFAAAILPALGSEIQKIGYYLLRAIPLLVLFVIPGLNLLAPPLWLLLNAWFLALEYCDFSLENHDVPFSKQKQWLRRHRWGAIGFGSAVVLMMMVPLLNLATMPAAVIGATLFVTRAAPEAD